MKHLKELNYTDIIQRKMLYVNTCISFCILTAIYFEISHLLFSLNIYGSSIKYIFVTSISAGFVGNLAGMFLLGKYSSRKIYIITDVIFVLLTVIILIRDSLNIVGNYISSSLLFSNELIIPISLSILPFLLGLKIHYFMKISSGNFIDDKNGVITLIISIIIGAIAGIGLFTMFSFIREYAYLQSILYLAMIPTIYFIKLPYNLSPQYTHEQKDISDDMNENISFRDDVYFTFLNISCIIIYLYLGYIIIEKNYGGMLHIKLLFIITTLISLLIGITISKYVKNAFWYVYSEMLFPIAFILFLTGTFYEYSNNYLYMKIIFFMIPASVYGFSFYKNIVMITVHYKHDKVFNIINYSMFVLPVPILIALCLTEFTTIVFYIFLYIIMLMNVIISGIYLLQKSINKYKKIIYFTFSLLFIPAIFIFNKYYNIHFNNELFIKNIDGYKLLYNNKYNSLFINNNNEIVSHGNIIFLNSDSAIRNLKKIILPVLLFGKKDNILFIDGNQKFFRNTSISYFNNYKVLDYIPERYVDYEILPLDGKQQYVVDKRNILSLLKKHDNIYDVIVDIPNILDQKYYSFRYSKQYYNICQKILKNNGIFAQTYNINFVKPDIISISWNSIKYIYNNVIGFQCGDMIIILASNDSKRLKVNENNYNEINDLISNNEDIIYLFYNADHILSHCIYSDKNKIKYNTNKKINIITQYFNNSTSIMSDNVKNDYLSSGNEFINLIPDENIYFKRNIISNLLRNAELFSLLKQSELSGVMKDYENEAVVLKNIENKFSYRNDLKKYLNQILTMKKDYYLNTAIIMEKDKKWDEAKTLYSALLKIDDNHFEANYRIGLLYITLQNINDALIFMKKAMKLKNDDPRVQYQMGVLLFSSGKAQDALNYLERAAELKQETSSLYLYMGFCNEELGKLNDAKIYYQKAIMIDPNDSNIKLSIDRINIKIQEEIDKWKTKDPENQNEAEQGENIPLPINKSAYEWRITDQEAKKLKGKE